MSDTDHSAESDASPARGAPKGGRAGTRWWARIAQTIAILAISVGALVGVEVGLRAVFPERVVRVPPPETPVFEFHPEYLIALKPDLERSFFHFPDNGGDTVVWRTNSDGFRGPPLQPTPDFRVFVYGDSNIQARFSPHERSFVGRLQAYLQAERGDVVEVVNAGVDGSGPEQALLRFTEEAAVYAPDLVVFNVFADNDFGDLIRNRLVELGPDGALTWTTHERVPDQQLKRARREYYQDLVASLMIVRMAGRVLPRAGAGDAPARPVDELDDFVRESVAAEYRVYESRGASEFSHFFDHYDADVATTPDAESADVKRALMSGVLAAVDSVARARDVPLVVVIEPSVIDLAPENVAWDVEPFRQAPGYRPTNLSDAVVEACIEHHLRCVNLFELFEANQPNELYLLRDDHWSEQGQDLAARATASFISDSILGGGEGAGRAGGPGAR